MPVLVKFKKIVIRLLLDRTFGIHLHAFHGDSELVIGVNPVKVIQGTLPHSIQNWVLDWSRQHEKEVLMKSATGRYIN